MSDVRQVYVRLLDEGVDVWRPVRAEHVGGDVYCISAQTYESDIETWEFEPGDFVLCREVDANGGQMLAAYARAEGESHAH